MSDALVVILAGLVFVGFSVFAVWFLRREYYLRGKLNMFACAMHVGVIVLHGVFSALVIWGLGSVPPLGPTGALGIALIVIGLGLTAYAMNFFQPIKRWPIKRWLGYTQDKLITTGIFSYTRNPQFLCYGLVVFGACAAWCTWPVIFVLLSYGGLVYAITKVEEEHLVRVFGKAYEEYCARTPRYIGLPKD
jgi:protein-S-isoprenylcysteine O-methyltransferase Ste14